MTRLLRIQYPGTMYHIISRGIGRMTVFYDEENIRGIDKGKNI